MDVDGDKQPHKEALKFFTQILSYKESLSLRLFVSFERVRERKRESVGRGTSKGLTRVALCFIAAFRGSSLGFESV